MAYVSKHGVDVLFGGDGATGDLNDTWSWDGTSWTQKNPSTSPSTRRGMAMAYDPNLDEIILYGGYNGSNLLGDTWAWNGTTWTELSPSVSPGPLAFATMQWDPSLGELVLFGGATSTGNSPGFGGGSSPPSESSATWAFDGSSWTELSPSTSPPARDDASMAYDTSAGNLVLFGGYDASGTYLDDTWVFDGSTWTEQSPYASPPALAGASNAIAYDAALQRIVLFGGTNSSGTTTSSFYVWNGQTDTWGVLNNEITAADRSGEALAPAAGNGQVVFFAGYSSDFQGVYDDTQLLDWGIRGANTKDATLSFPVDDTTSATVDLGSGNLHVAETPLSYAGTGMNLSTSFVYDSKSYVWQPSPGMSLNPLPDGSIEVDGLFDALGVYDFAYRSGAFVSPPGVDATLSYDAGSNTYALTFDKTQVVDTFSAPTTSSPGYLTSIEDRNGDTIAVNGTGGGFPSYVDTRGRTVDATWNPSTTTETWTGPDGRSWNAVYNASSEMISITDPNDATTSFSYGPTGQLSQITSPNGNELRFGYDDNLKIDSVTEVTDNQAGTGPTTTLGFQAVPAGSSGQYEVVVTDPNGHASTYVDAYGGQSLKVTDANGNTESSSYSPDRNPEALTNGLTQVATLSYDTNNNLTKLAAPASGSGQSPASNYLSYATSGPKGGTWLPSSAVNGEGDCQSFAYDTAGNLTATYAGLAPTSGTHNCDGVTSGPGSSSVKNAYQGDGSVSCGGKNGELCQTTDGNGNTTTYAYDSLGQLTSITGPGGSCASGSRSLCTSYTYEANNSRVATVTDGKGQVTTYTYDPDDRVTQILSDGASSCDYASGDCISFTYDANGNMTGRHDSSGLTTFVYDSLDRLMKEELPGGENACAGSSPGAITYGYDAASNLTSYCDAGGSVTYTYDPANRLTGVATESGSCTPGSTVQPCTQFGYNAANEVTSITYPSSTGMVASMTYDNAGDQTGAKVTEGSTTLENLTYSFTSGTSDKALRQSVDDLLSGVTTTYGYDRHDRLTSASTGDPSTSSSYSYDADSNIVQQTVNGTTTSFAYTAWDAPCWSYEGTSSNGCTSPPSGATSYYGDANGNYTSSSAGASLAYNPLNQTTSMKPAGGDALSMAYTGVGSAQRTEAGSTSFTNNLFGVASSTNGSTTSWFTHLPTAQQGGFSVLSGPQGPPAAAAGFLLSSILVGSSRYYVYYDGHGSIAGVVNASGTQVASFTYTPYGQTTASGSDPGVDPFRFQGGYQDTTGFYKFGTRYYQPSIGVWTQLDPLLTSYQRGYTFDSGNPVNYVDAYGEKTSTLAISLLAAAGVLAVAAGGVPLAFALIDEEATGLSAALALAGGFGAIGAGLVGIGTAIASFF